MVILYIVLIAYILAVNFYAFLLVKSFSEKERAREAQKQAMPLAIDNTTTPQTEKFIGKLCITGALGGAITIYVCMFLYKFQRANLLLMVLMPILGVLNIYFWVLLFRSGFSFFLIR